MTPERKIALLEVQLDLALNYLTSVCDKAETKEKCLLCGERFADKTDFGHECPLPAARDFLKGPVAQAESVLLSLAIGDVKFFDRELSAEEVREVAEEALAPHGYSLAGESGTSVVIDRTLSTEEMQGVFEKVQARPRSFAGENDEGHMLVVGKDGQPDMVREDELREMDAALVAGAQESVRKIEEREQDVLGDDGVQKIADDMRASLTTREREILDADPTEGPRVTPEFIRKAQDRALERLRTHGAEPPDPTEESTAAFMDELCEGEEEPDPPGHEPLKLELTPEMISNMTEDED